MDNTKQSSFYQKYLREGRVASKMNLHDMEGAYSALRDKTTDYAKQIKAMINVHKKVVEIYEKADDEHDNLSRPF